MQPSTFIGAERSAPGRTVRSTHASDRAAAVGGPGSRRATCRWWRPRPPRRWPAFADDPAGLVIASRRLIERRPAAAPAVVAGVAGAVLPRPAFEAMEPPPTSSGTARRWRWPATSRAGRWPSSAGPTRPAPLCGCGAGWAEASTRPTGSWSCRQDGTAGGAPTGSRGTASTPGSCRAGEVDAAARRCVLALLEAAALGPDSFLAATGSGALAAAARDAQRPVWLVAGVGRILPGPLYDALIRRVGDDPAFEVVPLDAVDEIAGPAGPVPRSRLARPSVPGSRRTPPLLRLSRADPRYDPRAMALPEPEPAPETTEAGGEQEAPPSAPPSTDARARSPRGHRGDRARSCRGAGPASGCRTRAASRPRRPGSGWPGCRWRRCTRARWNGAGRRRRPSPPPTACRSTTCPACSRPTTANGRAARSRSCAAPTCGSSSR